MQRIRIVFLALAATILVVSSARSASFEVYLEGFTENPETDNIGHVSMYIHVDGSSPWMLESEGIAGACQGWRESTGSGFINGPSIFMSAHDERAATSHLYVDYPLQDGLLFWINCTAPVTGLSQIHFWNAPDIGNYGDSEYPGEVQLVELTASRAVFSTVVVGTTTSTWGRIKALFP